MGREEEKGHLPPQKTTLELYWNLTNSADLKTLSRLLKAPFITTRKSPTPFDELIIIIIYLFFAKGPRIRFPENKGEERKLYWLL